MKLWIIDDEVYILEGIKNLVEQCFPSYEIKSFHSAQAAMMQLDVESPDIVISDIVMNQMSGLDFVQELRRYNSTAKVIIISGYSDFEYARRSIDLMVEGYLLKPIQQDRLIKLIQNAALKAEQENDEQKNRDDSKKKLLQDLTRYQYYRSDVEQDLRRLGLSELFKQFRLCFFTVMDYQILEQMENMHSFEDFIQKIRDVIHRNMSKLRGAYIYTELKSWNFVFVSNDADYALKKVAHDIQDTLRDTLSLTSQFSVSGSCFGPEAVYPAYMKAEAIVQGLIAQAPAADHRISLERMVKLVEHSFLVTVSQGKTHEIPGILMFLLEYGVSHRDKTDDLLDSMGKLYDQTCRFLARHYSEEEIKIPAPPQKDADFDALYSAYLHLFDAISQLGELPAGEKKRAICDAVCKIIAQDYQDTSLESVADRIQLSPAYLSVIFKEEMKISFKNYLIQVRLENAKKLLEQGVRVADAAARVGYTDIKYFSQMFKKHTGYLPRAHRADEK